MMVRPICCPTCGHHLENVSSGIVLDRKTNTIMTPLGTAKLTPTIADLAELLVEVMPEFACNERIYMHIWGRRGIVVDGSSIIAAVRRLRQVIMPLGLSIENRSRVGYRILKTWSQEKAA